MAETFKVHDAWGGGCGHGYRSQPPALCVACVQKTGIAEASSAQADVLLERQAELAATAGKFEAQLDR